MAQLPKGGLVGGHGKPIHGSCAIYFPSGIYNSHHETILNSVGRNPFLSDLRSFDPNPEDFLGGLSPSIIQKKVEK